MASPKGRIPVLPPLPGLQLRISTSNLRIWFLAITLTLHHHSQLYHLHQIPQTSILATEFSTIWFIRASSHLISVWQFPQLTSTQFSQLAQHPIPAVIPNYFQCLQTLLTSNLTKIPFARLILTFSDPPISHSNLPPPRPHPRFCPNSIRQPILKNDKYTRANFFPPGNSSSAFPSTSPIPTFRPLHLTSNDQLPPPITAQLPTLPADAPSSGLTRCRS